MIVFSSLIIQNLWDPQKNFCLDTIIHIWSPGFGHPITQKTEWWRPKMKTQNPCFQDSSPMTQWHFCNKLFQWGPFNQWLVPSIWPLELLPVTLHLSENFSLKNFPLLTSLFSLPSHFHFHPHIPARYLHGTTVRVRRLNEAWEDRPCLKNNASSKLWTRPESSPASLALCHRVHTSLSPSQVRHYLPGAVNLSLSLSIFHVPGLVLVWVFRWMWKGFLIYSTDVGCGLWDMLIEFFPYGFLGKICILLL